MLPFYLQFSGLDDVIHFALKAPTLPHLFWEMEEKSTKICVNPFGPQPALAAYACCRLVDRLSGAPSPRHEPIQLRCGRLNLQSSAPSWLDQTSRD